MPDYETPRDADEFDTAEEYAEAARAQASPVDEPKHEIAVREQGAMTAYSPSANVGAAVAEWRRIQQELEAALGPDCIMKIQGKDFRKKSFWRGVKRAFSLSAEAVDEQVIVEYADGSFAALAVSGAGDRRVPPGSAPITDVTIRFVVRASHPQTGMVQDGVGACSRTEKMSFVKVYDREAGGKVFRKDERGERIVDEVKTFENASFHNIEAHAFTRATNRAIADLVGFGEVSAEEINPHAQHDDGPPQRAPRSTGQAPSPTPAAPCPAKEYTQLHLGVQYSADVTYLAPQDKWKDKTRGKQKSVRLEDVHDDKGEPCTLPDNLFWMTLSDPEKNGWRGGSRVRFYCCEDFKEPGEVWKWKSDDGQAFFCYIEKVRNASTPQEDATGGTGPQDEEAMGGAAQGAAQPRGFPDDPPF